MFCTCSWCILLDLLPCYGLGDSRWAMSMLPGLLHGIWCRNMRQTLKTRLVKSCQIVHREHMYSHGAWWSFLFHLNCFCIDTFRLAVASTDLYKLTFRTDIYKYMYIYIHVFRWCPDICFEVCCIIFFLPSKCVDCRQSLSISDWQV
jgi:hypothetical protein